MVRISVGGVRSWRWGLLFCALAIPRTAQPPAVWAQVSATCHVMEMKDQIAPGDLPRAVRLDGIGNSHLEITATPEAQMWFDQALNLLHDFWDYEAARAFEQGVRADAKCAMCYWGLYQAESFYHSIAQDYARPALQAAVRLKGEVSERDRLYIEALAARAGIGKREDATGLWRAIVKQYPGDIQARLFLAQSVGFEERLQLLEAILQEDPKNSAANHYYIHALEGTEHPEKALRSAEVLASLAPASGHMVHMPGHIVFRMGDYASAEKSFAESTAVDERYMREQHVSADNDWNYVHNLMYAIANLMEEGKLLEAARLSGKLEGARGEFESTLYLNSARDSMTRLGARLPVALRTGDWALAIELLKSPGKAAGRPNLNALAQEVADFAAGMRAIEARQVERAREASTRFDDGLKALSAAKTGETKRAAAGAKKLEVNPDALLEPLVSSLSVMSQELRASVMAAQRKVAEAQESFAKAAQAEQELGYREPPIYIRPVEETEGAAMLAAGEWEAAKAGYRRALAERPNSGFALYGIAAASEKSGDAAAAVKDYSAFLAAWGHGDAQLPQIKRARRYVATRR